jgi:predicted SAM-dependent methyltransferase
LNVDIVDSEFDIDLGNGKLPWVDNSFDVVVSQHVIEHLELDSELIPLLNEFKRTMKSGGEIWLSCPDMEKVCRGYVEDRGASLIQDRQTRFPWWNLGGMPDQQIINHLFHQGGDHKNLFDFDLLKWVLEKCQFTNCVKVSEKELLERFPGFPERKDDAQALYVKANA